MIVGLEEIGVNEKGRAHEDASEDASNTSSVPSRESNWTNTLVEPPGRNRLRADVRNRKVGGTLRRSQVFWTAVALVGAINGSTARAQQPAGPGSSLIEPQSSPARHRIRRQRRRPMRRVTRMGLP